MRVRVLGWVRVSIDVLFALGKTTVRVAVVIYRQHLHRETMRNGHEHASTEWRHLHDLERHIDAIGVSFPL